MDQHIVDSVFRFALTFAAGLAMWDLEKRALLAGHNGTMLRLVFIGFGVLAGAVSGDVLKAVAAVAVAP